MEATKIEENPQVEIEEKAADRVVHIPLGLLKSVIGVGEPWDGDHNEVDAVPRHLLLFDLLSRDWVIIYDWFDIDHGHRLRVRGFDSKDQLSDFLAEEYAHEVRVNGIEMVLEKGRPRRFNIEVKPRIGF